MKRRDFLAGGVVAAGMLAYGQAARAQGVGELNAPFGPLKSAMDRVTRSVVGFRPYRETGFRLETQRIGRKDIVHNYGHGGGGVSLSWGVAEMAAELARAVGRNEVAVLGSGVIGLTTALVLRRAGAQATVYAERFPPDTTSNIAAASWFPTTVYKREAVGQGFINVLDSASERAFRRFQHLANHPKYGVYWFRHHVLRMAPRVGLAEHYPGGEAIYPGLRRNQTGHGPFGFEFWDSYYSLMIDPDIYLPAIIDDFVAAGGRMVQQRFETMRDVNALRERTVVNCLGMGARELFDDAALIPARGQLTMLLPQPEIDYGYAGSLDGRSLYMFPRRSAIVLGGSVGYGDWNDKVDPAEVERMVNGHALLASRTSFQPG